MALLVRARNPIWHSSVGDGAWLARELATEQPRSAAWLSASHTEIKGVQWWGLLLDPKKTIVIRTYAGDGWTQSGRGRARQHERGPRRVARNRQAVMPLGGKEKYAYDEAVIGAASVIGIVVAPGATKATRRKARRLATKFGLPYLGSISHIK